MEWRDMAKKKAARKNPATKKVTKKKAPHPVSRAASGDLTARRQRALKIIAELRKLYPGAECALKHKSALQLLISTILSAQSTDDTVNKVTPELFAIYPDAQSLAEADPADVEMRIHRTGFFRQKTKSIIGACRRIVEDHNGKVPDTLDALIQLPGVARKTANVVLGTWFGKNEGVVVDTHIGRLAHRLGLTWSSKNEKDAVKIEQDLMQVLPREEWTFTGHALIWHGRKVCPSRKPKCGQCTLNKLCPAAFSFDENPDGAAGGKVAARAARKA
jgi:endonuclease-3